MFPMPQRKCLQSHFVIKLLNVRTESVVWVNYKQTFSGARQVFLSDFQPTIDESNELDYEVFEWEILTSNTNRSETGGLSNL